MEKINASQQMKNTGRKKKKEDFFKFSFLIIKVILGFWAR